jgi:hypothetical protein
MSGALAASTLANASLVLPSGALAASIAIAASIALASTEGCGEVHAAIKTTIAAQRMA